MTDAESPYLKNFSVYITLSTKKDYHIDTAQISDLYMIEDIFSYSITGKLEFEDRMGSLEFGPLTGNEKLIIEYGVENKQTREFRIQKVGRATPLWSNAEGKMNHIQLFFVDDLFPNLIEREYSRSWGKRVKYSDIIRHIAEKMGKVENWDEFEDTDEKITNFYIPYWTPLQSINWLLRRGTGSKSKSPGYVFYNSTKEDNKISSNLVTLDKLLNMNPVLDIGGRGKYKFQEENPIFTNKILSYNISGLDNFSKLELKGSTRRGYDFTRKKFLEESYRFKDDLIARHTMLGRKTLFDDISDERTSYKNLNVKDENLIDNIYVYEWIKRYCMQQIVTITVPGHEERYTGRLIEIEWPSADENEVMNKNFSGYYLIKSITHHFRGQGRPPFRQKMVLIKNAYWDSDRSELVDSVDKKV